MPVTVDSRSLKKQGWVRHFRDLYHRRETIRYLVSTQLKSGHRDKVLGHLWNLLDPLLFMFVYYFVFGVLMGQSDQARGGEFMIYIFVGILAWRFFDNSVSQAIVCIRQNRGIIHEIYFPKSIFPVAVCFARLYDFLWGLFVLFVVLLIFSQPISIHVLWVLPLIVAQLLFTLGVAFIGAYLGAFFADTSNIVSAVMRLTFYMTPIFYYVRGEKARISDPDTLFIYMLNPISCFYECYRDALIYARVPEPRYMVYAGVVSIVVAAVGFVVFTTGEGKFAKYV